MLCLGSVSAEELKDISNSTLETVNDNSQNQNIVIDEISNTDDALGESTVGVHDENEILRVRDNEDVLGDEVPQVRDKSTGQTEVTVPVGTSVTIEAFMTYDDGGYMWGLQKATDSSFTNKENVNYYQTGHAYWHDFYTATLDAEGDIYFRIHNYNDRYGIDSQPLIYHVGGSSSSTKETSVSISVPSNGTTNESVSIPYQITEKGTSTGVSNGTLTFYNDDAQIGSPITLSSSSGTFTYTFTSAGTYNIKAVYTASSGYENSESDTSSIVVSDKVKGKLNVTLIRNGENALVKPGDTVYFRVTYSEPITENLELWINDYKLGDEDGGSSTYITFDESDVGFNDVFIKFLGNDDYEACVSNNVTINVVKPVETFISLELNTTDVLVNGKILITPKVVDADGNNVTVGSVTIGKDLYGYNDIARINAGETYVYTVDSNSFNPYNNPYSLYARYGGATGESAIYASSQTDSATRYYHVYSNTLALTVNGEEEITVPVGSAVNLLATVGNGQGTIVIVDKNGVETEITGETSIRLDDVGNYTYYAKFTRAANSYYASVESAPVIVHVEDVAAPVIEIEIDKTSVSKDGNITITPAVTGGSDEKGIVNFYDENNISIGSINLSSESSFVYTVTGEAGTSHSIFAEYVDSNTIYPSVNSTRKVYKIKDVLIITLARNGDDALVKPGDTVYFIITYSKPIAENLELWINDYKLGDEDGESSTYIAFDDSDVGSNDVFIKFLGNDDYEACVSNNVTIKVVNPIETTITLELSTNELTSTNNITITPKVVEKESGKEVTVGRISIYDDHSNYLPTINAGESVNLSATSQSPYNNPYYLNADYYGASTDDAIYSSSRTTSGIPYYFINSNSLTLTVNGLNETTVEEGMSFDVFADLYAGEGEITLFVNGEANVTLTKNTQTPLTLPVGDYILKAKYVKAEDYYESCESNEVTVHVAEKQTIENIIKVSVDNVILPAKAVIVVNATIDGKYTIDVNGTEVNVTVAGGIGSESVELNAGEYYANVTGYDEATITNAVFTVYPAPKVGQLIIRDATYPENATIALSGEGNVTIYIEYYLIKPTANPTTERITFNVGGNVKVIDELVNGSYVGAFSAVINQTGDFTINASYYAWQLLEGEYSFDSENILSYSVIITEPSVKPKDVVLNDTVLSISNGTAPTFSIDLANATGNLTVNVDGKNYSAELKDGKATVEITDLPAGNYTASVTYSGDANYKYSSIQVSFKVDEKASPDANSTFDVNIPSGSTNPVFSISLANATGNLTVTVANKTYTKELVNGSASITVEDLAPGSYNAVVAYSGDKNYNGISNNVTFTVPTPKLAGKDIAAVYGSTASYRILVTADGKAIVGEKVSITFNGKTYRVATDKNGYATLKLNTNLKVKKYPINVAFKGVKVSNTLTVKHLIIAKNLKIKKSKKVVKIKVKTNKVNGKFLKGKKLKLKLKGKTLKAKINKKGVATFKVKKNILKKLKVGKKYKYTVSYGKDTVTKKIKVKR
jgi:hypothetical protein